MKRLVLHHARLLPQIVYSRLIPLSNGLAFALAPRDNDISYWESSVS